jgi:TPR repeat protein
MAKRKNRKNVQRQTDAHISSHTIGSKATTIHKEAQNVEADTEDSSIRSATTNYFQFAKMLGYAEDIYRDIFRKTWKIKWGIEWTDDESCGALLLQKYPNFHFQKLQRSLASNGVLSKWDISLLRQVFDGIKQDLQYSNILMTIKKVVEIRNLWAHNAERKMNDQSFEENYTTLCTALSTISGFDLNTYTKLRYASIDSEEEMLRYLGSEETATEAAILLKEEGNRHYRNQHFVAAKEQYTIAIQSLGVIKPTVLAELYSNRSQTNSKLKEYSLAREDAQRSIELAPNWFRAHERMAAASEYLCVYAKTASHLERAIGIIHSHDDQDKMRNHLAKLKQQLGRIQLQLDKAERCEHMNFAYSPEFVNSPAMRNVDCARLGLQLDANLDQMFNMAASKIPSGEMRHIFLGHRAMREGRYSDAIREYRIAAEIYQSPEGMYNLGLTFSNGVGCEVDTTQAVYWYEKAASSTITERNKESNKLGIGYALVALGNYHERGIHYSQNGHRSLELYRESVKYDAPAGFNLLGLCHMEGKYGVERNFALAHDLFRLSAEKLGNEAMNNLGELNFRLGRFDIAARWFNSAYRYGNLPAKDKHDRCAELSSSRLTVVTDQFIEEFFQCIQASPILPKDLNHVPSFEELCAICPRTPYVEQLLAAKRMIMKAIRLLLNNPWSIVEFDAIQLAVKATRVPDGKLVISQELRFFDLWLAQKSPRTPRGISECDMAILKHPNLNHGELASYYMNLHHRFPSDLYFALRNGCFQMFSDIRNTNCVDGLASFQHAYRLLPSPDDDNCPQTIDLLYSMAVANRLTNNLKIATMFFQRYLRCAPSHGHRKVPEAWYHLGALALTSLHAENRMETTLSKVKLCLEEGNTADKKLPIYFRVGDSPNRKLLEHALKIPTLHIPQTASLNTAEKVYGGELLVGPRRHAKLSGQYPLMLSKLREDDLTPLWKSNFWRTNGNIASTTPSAQSHVHFRSLAELNPCTIEILLSDLKDQIYDKLFLDCIVMSPPAFSGRAYNIVVEDSLREPMLVAVYDLSKEDLPRLLPGRTLKILRPYLRFSRDSTIRLRIDDPKRDFIICDEAYDMCWGCGRVQSHLKRCTKCNIAMYCSKDCQVMDWKKYAHQHACEELKTWK